MQLKHCSQHVHFKLVATDFIYFSKCTVCAYPLYLSLSIFGQKYVEKHRFGQIIICPNSLSMIFKPLKHEICIILLSPSCWLHFLLYAAFFHAMKGDGDKKQSSFQNRQNRTIKILMNRVWISWNVNDIKDLWFIYDTVCEKNYLFESLQVDHVALEAFGRWFVWCFIVIFGTL